MRRISEDDRGVALIAVVVLGFVMMVLIATGLTVATSGLQQADGVQHSTSALDAAYAGVQDYVERVNVDKDYVQYGNPADPFSAASKPALKLPTGSATNPAFGFTTADSWATVSGSGGVAKFRYEVDTSNYQSGGIVRLRVTGYAGNRTRTLLANLRVKGFVDYVYFSDYEVADPALFGTPANCLQYAWQFSSGSRPATCADYQRTFGQNDIIYGNVHSNDTMYVCGTTFSGTVETPKLVKVSGCTSKSTTVKTTVSTLPMPSTNTAMKNQAACVYTGPTQIKYNSDGTMTVVSPWTKFTDISGAGSNPAACGSPVALGTATGARVPQLSRDLLYVQDVPSSPSDVNYWSSTTKPLLLSCIAADGSFSLLGTNGIGWSIGSGSDKIRYPALGETPATGWSNSADSTRWNTTTPAYGCRDGDLYVSGKVTTLTTAASENYVYVTDDITYADRTADVLGLVGQNAVLVYNPIDSSGQTMLSQYNLEIDAAIISVDHSFQVQNYDRGTDRGALVVFGSIAQKYRGATVTFDENTGAAISGYTKSYQYDTLLQTVAPPKFLEPSTTSFTVTRYASVPTAFAPTGAATP